MLLSPIQSLGFFTQSLNPFLTYILLYPILCNGFLHSEFHSLLHLTEPFTRFSLGLLYTGFAGRVLCTPMIRDAG